MQLRQLQLQTRVSSLIDRHRERLHVLEQQAALEGTHVRPYVDVEIKRIRQMIAQLEVKFQKLSEQPIDDAELEALTEDLPDPVVVSERAQISFDAQNRLASITIADVAGRDLNKSMVATSVVSSYVWIVAMLLLVLTLLLIAISLAALRFLSA